MHFLKNPDPWRRLYNDSEQSKDASHARNSNLAVIRIILGPIISSAIQLVWRILIQFEFVHTCNGTATN